MKFVLFVEGYTERNAVAPFFKRWLDKHLGNPVGIKVVRFEGWAELVKDAATKARLHLADPDVIAVISLLDLHGPTFYPPDAQSAGERYDSGKKYVESRAAQSKFHHFFAVHEIEAWLLSQPKLFPSDVRDLFPDKVKTPEEVNFNEPPAKLLNRLYKQAGRFTYKKVVYGDQLFKKLDVDEARAKCPRLKAMLDKMLELAKAAGL